MSCIEVALVRLFGYTSCELLCAKSRITLQLKLRAELRQECSGMVTREDGVTHFLQGRDVVHPPVPVVVSLNPR